MKHSTKDGPQGQGNAAKLRDKAEPPFCWQNKEALRMIESQSGSPDSALLLYLRLTWIASDQTTRFHNGNQFTISHAALARLTNLSIATIKRRLKDLAELRLIEVFTPKLKSPCTIRLLSLNEPKKEK